MVVIIPFIPEVENFGFVCSINLLGKIITIYIIFRNKNEIHSGSKFYDVLQKANF